MKTFGPLYAKSSTNKIKMWKATVKDDGTLETTFGYVNGEKNTSSKKAVSKNIGKSNKTTPYEQGCLEAQSKMNKKLDEGYVINQSDIDNQTLKLPMLAHKFIDRGHDIIYPASTQPKLNGVRCLVTKDIKYYSRNGKEYDTLGHLNSPIQKIFDAIGKECELDGEIFVKDWNFQEIIRAVKKSRKNVSSQLEFWIFDCTLQNTSFNDRYKTLLEVFKSLGTLEGSYFTIDKVKLVPTLSVKDKDHILSCHTAYTKDNFEGTIIRNQNGFYVYKHRSVDLQKYKTFIDEEFMIIGGHEGTGNDTGTVIFECITKNGKTFSVRPKGSRETRKDWLSNIEDIKGHELTVRYQNLSEDQIPIFPVGLAIRNYEL